jgi:cell fate regulator YaaT (PSP1 superfamily)
MSCAGCQAKEILNKSNIIYDTDVISCGKLDSHDWLNDIPVTEHSLITEVRFKNTRKDFFINKHKIQLKRGDYVAVATAQGHDVGQVALTGRMAALQLQKKSPKSAVENIIFRKASLADIEKLHQSRTREKPVMIRARQLVEQQGLDMKISEVEFQGDGTKATFYYIADKRVDFRELIKVFAREFGIRVEMRQIGARQEAAMVGGIGSCGKALCCSTWRTNLDSVSANAARIQQLPHNIQKLTGQCGKLKCCLMYEMDSYMEAQNDFPDILLELETAQGIAYPKKREVLKRIVWYGMSKTENSKLIPLSLDRIKEIIMLNKKGINVPSLIVGGEVPVVKESDYKSFENDFSILESSKKPKKKKRNNFKKSKPKQTNIAN